MVIHNQPNKEQIDVYENELEAQILRLQALKQKASGWAPVDVKSAEELGKDIAAIKLNRIQLKTLEEAAESKVVAMKTRYPDDFLKMVITDEDVKAFMFGAKPTTKTGTTAGRSTGTNWYDKVVGYIPDSGIDKDALYKVVVEKEPEANPDFIKRAIGNDGHVNGQKLSIPSIISKGMAVFKDGKVWKIEVVPGTEPVAAEPAAEPTKAEAEAEAAAEPAEAAEAEAIKKKSGK